MTRRWEGNELEGAVVSRPSFWFNMLTQRWLCEKVGSPGAQGVEEESWKKNSWATGTPEPAGTRAGDLKF